MSLIAVSGKGFEGLVIIQTFAQPCDIPQPRDCPARNGGHQCIYHAKECSAVRHPEMTEV